MCVYVCESIDCEHAVIGKTCNSQLSYLQFKKKLSYGTMQLHFLSAQRSYRQSTTSILSYKVKVNEFSMYAQYNTLHMDSLAIL